jgi:hypothetical protein
VDGRSLTEYKTQSHLKKCGGFNFTANFERTLECVLVLLLVLVFTIQEGSLQTP